MRILSAASAFPAHYYPQTVLRDALKMFWGPRLESPRLLDRLWANAGVDGRYLVRPMEEYPAIDTWGKANDIWIQAAEDLGSTAICRALAAAGRVIDAGRGAIDAGSDVSEIGALFFVSITGVSSPSIDARLINRMGLPRNLRRIPIFGLGCVAGAAGIARAADYVRAYPEQIAILLSVELCSLTMQHDDLSIANQISAALFGDGAAAVVIAGDGVEDRSKNGSAPRIVDTRSSFYPDTEDVMGWAISERGFRIVLSPEVPNVIRENLGRDVDGFLAQHGLTRGDIGSWVLHTGGPKVLEATQEALGIPKSAIAASWDMLRRTGNLSSASVLLVLEETMARRRPPPDTWGVLAAMGPGFCSELVLLRW
jgi:alkylresorcinol/alkylpyrone synthase